MFKWISGSVYSLQATFYENNITFNASSASKLMDYAWCMVGFDEEEKKMAVKGVPKTDIERNIVSIENLHRLSMGKGYARISNKNMVQLAQKIAGRNCIGEKLNVRYDDREQLLIVDLQGGDN